MPKPAVARAPAIRGRHGARQASLAVSGDGERWFLINASPDLREQIQAQAILHPKRGLRSSPIEGVILTGADVDAIAGLLHLRERQPFTLYGSDRVLGVLKANPIFNVLSDECVRRETVPLGRAFEPRHVDGSGSGLAGRAVRRAGQGRALSRDRLVAAGAGRQGGRHGRRRDRVTAASGWSTSPAAPA